MLKELKKLEKYQYYILFIILGFFVGYLNPFDGFTLGGVESGAGGVQPPPFTTSDRAVGTFDPGPSPSPSPSPSPGPSPGPSPSPSASNISCSGGYCCTHNGYTESDICIDKNGSNVDVSKCSDCKGMWNPEKAGALLWIAAIAIVVGLFLWIVLGGHKTIRRYANRPQSGQ